MRFRFFIHPDLRGAYDRMSFSHKLIFLVVHGVDRMDLWHRLPVFLGLLYLAGRRSLQQSYNLHNVGKMEEPPFGLDEHPFRTADGRYYDPENASAGGQMAFFGRNVRPIDQKDQLTDPDPFVVTTKLLERRKFIDTGKQLNVIVSAWAQFMIHDWVDHLEDCTDQLLNVLSNPSSSTPPGQSPRVQMELRQATQTVELLGGRDGSVIYGNNQREGSRVRTGVDGKLKVGEGKLLPHDERGRAQSGDTRNSWAGVSLLQALFVQEHNAVCDALKEKNPHFDDEKLYQHSRLVTSAVIAKIHTIDWTVELLKTATLKAAMRINWYGFLGKTFKRVFGHVGGRTLGPALGGLVGLREPNDHGIPYSLTEEFVSVYRMHCLIPDVLELKSTDFPPGPNKAPASLEKRISMEDLVGVKGEEVMADLGLENQLVSMGLQACGALELWNYPSFFRNLVSEDADGTERADRVDLPTLEIYRDRERSVPRYNQFRRDMLMLPISRWEDLTHDAEAIKALREVYRDDIEKVDLLVGLMAEKKIKGFAISETAFFVFVLMASRRLECDRFFTSHFNESTYTKRGLEWVNSTESLKDVIRRHHPEIAEKWINATSAFSVWDAPPNSFNLIPLYLRV